jgi:hypothetical protein
VGHEHRRLVERSEQHVREGLDRDRSHPPALDDGPERGGHEAEAVLRIDLAPLLPPENDWCLDQHHTSHGRIEAGVEEGHAPKSQLFDGVVALGRGNHHLLADRYFQFLHDGSEQLLLATEVVIQRAARNTRSFGDLLTPCRDETVRGEQLARCGQ